MSGEKKRQLVRRFFCAENGRCSYGSAWKFDVERLKHCLDREYKRMVRTRSGIQDEQFSVIYVNEYYKIEKQLKILHNVFSTGGLKGLPVICASVNSSKCTLPRTLYLSELLVAEDEALDVNTLTSFFERHQQRSPLSLSEIRALPNMVRISLLQRLRDCIENSGRERAVVLRNVLTSLDRLDDLDFEEAFESLNMVNHILMADAEYRMLDGPSRGRLMERVTELSKKVGCSETELAEAVIRCSGEAGAAYSIVGNGRRELLKTLGYRERKSMSKCAKITVMTATQLVLTLLVLLVIGKGFLSVFAFLPMYSIINTILINVLTRCIKPKPLLRYELGCDVGSENRTLVCVPVLVTSENGIEAAMCDIESHYLANRLKNVEFAILGDFVDANEERNERDNELLRIARHEIDRLNKKYCADDDPIFHYLHRKRQFNEADKVFMGRERKRGAVNAVMRLIKNVDGAEFLCNYPPLEGDFKYLTVLDADTCLPAGSLGKLIGTASCSINRPKYDSNGKRCDGYVIIAPRMASLSRAAAATPFAYLVSGESGLSPYDPAVSDFFQDTFGEGNFGGKGIIEIDGFLRSAASGLPDNAILSHDMLEGCLAGAAYADDIVLYDGEPSTFFSWWKRRHRWLRGDIQLLRFIFGKERSQTDCLARYKIIENVRRGAFNISVFIGIMLGCILNSTMLLSVSFAAFFIDPIVSIVCGVIGLMRQRSALKPIVLLIRRRLMELCTLPYAFLCDIDAWVRALTRMLFTHRGLLEWQTAAMSERKGNADLSFYIKKLFIAELSGAALILLWLSSRFLSFAVPFVAVLTGIVFVLAPIVVYSLDKKRKRPALGNADRGLLIEIARATWQFFADNMTEKTSYFPPDNFQQEPLKKNGRDAEQIAFVTSPTNIGMGLMAIVCANDMGFISNAEAVERLDRSVTSIERAEKWYGHLFNWYELRSLSVLKPRFVSSVDSGNLFACLMVAEAKLRELEVPGAEELAGRVAALRSQMDFTKLYDKKSKLFYVGLEFDEGRFTASHYDLMASEARLTSFSAIAAGQIGTEHWFRLSRLMCDAPGGRVLKSWSGTMFEYLMPLIFMEVIQRSMQFETCRNAVLTQILYAEGRHPWGVSESGYYAFDRNLKYQYKAFGVPSLGLMHQNERRDVVAPYASVLALLCEPFEAVENICAMRDEGWLGKYGMYEAVDYSFETHASGRIVKSFMAHHQGMSICAINNAVNGNIIVKRFMRIPEVRAFEQLLFENMPDTPIKLNTFRSCYDFKQNKQSRDESFVLAEQSTGGVISNGNYSVFIDRAGRGFSKCGDCFLTRFRCGSGERSGIEFYISIDDRVYSCGGEITVRPELIRLEGRHGSVKTRLEAIVSAEHDCEIRTLTVINSGMNSIAVKVGVFAEISLVRYQEDIAHPSFVKICTDCRLEDDVMLFNSRKKPGRTEQFGFFCLLSPHETALSSDGAHLPGRLNSYKDAMRRNSASKQADFTAPVEPVYTAITELRIQPGGSSKIVLIAGCAESRLAALEAVSRTKLRLNGISEIVKLNSYALLHDFNIDFKGFKLAQQLAGRLCGGHVSESKSGFSPYGLVGRETLWRFGVSGDAPIALYRLSDGQGLRRLREIAAACRFLNEIKVEMDVIVIGKYPHEYANRLRASAEEAIQGINNITLIHAFNLSEMECEYFDSVKTVEIEPDGVDKPMGSLEPEGKKNCTMRSLPVIHRELLMYNGYGGFDTEKGEYVIYPHEGNVTPMPWSNVIAGKNIGTLVTESGGGYTFLNNSRLMRLTRWMNDAVSDPISEELVIYDKKTDEELSIPPRNGGEYEVVHGFGYTFFNVRTEKALLSAQHTVDEKLPVKYLRLCIQNNTNDEIEYCITVRCEWVIGDEQRRDGLAFSAFERGIMVQNRLCDRDGIGFAAVKNVVFHDKSANGALRLRAKCAALGKVNIDVVLGFCRFEDVNSTIDAADFERAIRSHAEFRQKKLRKLTVETGNAAFDAIVNERLLYQVYASRLTAKTGFYQSGGATGFRDQLQDVLSLLLTDPERARAQIITCASKQFKNGDVLHWWHDNGWGVRTRISDDRLFLPYAAAEYATATGDFEIFREKVSYLEEVKIADGKRDVYCQMQNSDDEETLCMHCLRAIEVSLTEGRNGLPLMGSGDWNDSMDNVGDNGGESVFLAFFTAFVIEKFLAAAEHFIDPELYERFDRRANAIRRRTEECAWNGEHYIRAFFADGTALDGSSGGCQIDCVTECFAVFSGAAHSSEAFRSVLNHLVDRENGLVRLLTPPFDAKCKREVGYIQGYLPGIRENGGQYTHAAAWCVIAACKLGMNETAQLLFDLINPANHGDVMNIDRYRGEPYAVAGDVYSVGKNAGRAGWTWYTGAAAWLYRAAVEWLLGIKRYGDTLCIDPCTDMKSFSVKFRYGENDGTTYIIDCTRTGNSRLTVDDCNADCVKLVDDGRIHRIYREF